MKTPMIWPCRITAETTGYNRRKLTIDATIEGAGDVKQAMQDYVARKKNSHQWLGVEIVALTPLGQHVRLIYGD